MSDQDGLGLFAGGQRARMYDDPVEAAAHEPQVIRDESPERVAGFTPPPPPPPDVQRGAGELVLASPQPAETAPPAPGMWQRLLIKVGAAQPPPTPDEVADRENERIVRQSTWTRAMSAAVVNPKGGSMKTPMTLLLADAIAEIRGGGVAAWEATEVPGDLSAIAEGDPPRGLTELLAAEDMINSAGMLAGYTAPQTSHAAVVGSVSAREELSPRDVWSVRSLLGTYYQIDIADTANNLQRPSMRALLDGADAVVIPCVVNYKSVSGLQRALRAVESVPGLRHRVILVVSHDGGPENPEVAQTLVANLAHHYRVKAVIEVPFDQAIRADGELAYSSLQPSTRLAMRAIARHVIDCFNTASATKTHNESE